MYDYWLNEQKSKFNKEESMQSINKDNYIREKDDYAMEVDNDTELFVKGDKHSMSINNDDYIVKFEKVSYEQFKKDLLTIDYYSTNYEIDKDEKVFKDIYDKIELPTRATQSSAGYDFKTPINFSVPGAIQTVNLEQKDVNGKIISYGQTSKYEPTILKVPTGIKAKMPKEVFLGLHVRSSIGVKKNILLANGTGIVDSDYYNNPDNEGHIWLMLYSYGIKTHSFEPGERIAQGIFQLYIRTDDDSNIVTARTGGIGSTNDEK